MDMILREIEKTEYCETTMNAKQPKEQCVTTRRLGWRTTPLVIIEHARKIVVATIGGTLLAIGIAMVVLPGPAIVVIPLALAILATEFMWARRWLATARELINQLGASK